MKNTFHYTVVIRKASKTVKYNDSIKSSVHIETIGVCIQTDNKVFRLYLEGK